MPPRKPDPLLSAENVAEILGVKVDWVYRHTSRGCSDPLPAIKFGGHLRFRQTDIDAWIDAHRTDAEQPQWQPRWESA